MAIFACRRPRTEWRAEQVADRFGRDVTLALFNLAFPVVFARPIPSLLSAREIGMMVD
ncbi:hypothetical protein QE361_001572 [Sphingomonas sp. SORGH_AS802]|uniref:hypothetical protein n=1 Tax=unclassified Sphingomonas TaxID=196159 RepID=UPI00285FA0C5|nr:MULTISPECIES: hypothetical protein [unclassified Sphingomonas]MDR6127049.1 hypothetical protein [Sphingomonas sp. SORGH_AS_0438]MDR6134589.1 hypothetical protein [Sphingomonas sp. SORGH_AS_0802]